MKSCSEIRDLVSLYIDDQMDAGERKKFESHIQICEACKKEYQVILKIASLCRDMQEEELPENFREELHEKLLKASNADDGNKLSRNVRHIRFFSSIAAGILVIFLLAGLYRSGVFDFIKYGRSTGRTNMSVQQAAPAAEAAQSAPSKAAAQDGGGNNQFGANIQAAVIQPSEEPKSEIDRSGTSDNRFITDLAIAPEKASGRTASITFLADKPEALVEKLKDAAINNGGEEKQKADVSVSGQVALEAVPSNEITLEFTIPNSSCDAFKNYLNTELSQFVSVPWSMTTEDLTDTLDELKKQSNVLDNEIKELEAGNDSNKDDEINQKKTEKSTVDSKIEAIRLGTDFTDVTILLKGK